jgi:hypothetical protein
MKRVLLLAVGIYILSAAPTFACSCVEYRSNRKAFRMARAVFIGTPISSSFLRRDAGEAESEGHSLFGTSVKFKVEKSWKGADGSEIVITSDSGLDLKFPCGFQFVEGNRYLVYAYGSRLEAATMCSRDITPLKDADVSTAKRLKQLNSFWFRTYARLSLFSAGSTQMS